MTDIQIDLDLILRNAEAGNPEAQYAMAYHYTLGLGVEKDAKKARDWYRKAAENNHPDAQLALGLYYNHPSYGGIRMKRSIGSVKPQNRETNTQSSF